MARKVIHIRPDNSMTGSVEDGDSQPLQAADVADTVIADAKRQIAAGEAAQTINVHLHTAQQPPGNYLWKRRRPAAVEDEAKQIAPPTPPNADFSEQVRDTLSQLQERSELDDLPPMPSGESITGERAFSLKEALAAADGDDDGGGILEPTNVPPEMTDAQRRAAGMKLVDDAVLSVVRRLSDGQVRYELALMAKNEQVEAMKGFATEAAVRGMSVDKLCDAILAERKVAERRNSFVYATRAIAEKDMAGATGEDISAIADKAVVTILDDLNLADES